MRRPKPTGIRGALLLGSLISLSGCGGGGGTGGGSPAPTPTYLSYGAVAVADLDGDGLPDVVAVYSSVSGAPPHPGFVAVYLQDPARPGHFRAASTYAVGNDPGSVAIGDLNGDGRPDIVTANAILATSGAGVSDVSVLLQDATQPGRFLPAVSYATGPNPQAVAIGDLDGDGKPDLAVADDGGVTLLLQSPAGPAGTFLPRQTIPVGGPVYSMALADLDGDGRLDLIVTNAVDVLVLLHDASASTGFATPRSYAAGAQPTAAVAADLNGDGALDIAVANIGTPSDPATASASVLLQDPANRGHFLGASTYATQLRTFSVATRDLNGDGLADVAVANLGSIGGPCPPTCSVVGSGVSVLLQDPDAPGHFQATVNYPPSGSDTVAAVAVADINGDGKADLVIAQGLGLFIRLQDPAHLGTFLAPAPISD
jgi:VCBS repeat protein/FG-GAP repeat protein